MTSTRLSAYSFAISLPFLTARPSRWARSDGRHGVSRWWMATALCWAFTPVPSIEVEPNSTRTRPSFIASITAFLDFSLLHS